LLAIKASEKIVVPSRNTVSTKSVGDPHHFLSFPATIVTVPASPPQLSDACSADDREEKNPFPQKNPQITASQRKPFRIIYLRLLVLVPCKRVNAAKQFPFSVRSESASHPSSTVFEVPVIVMCIRLPQSPAATAREGNPRL
jgi:hypothetical protein